MLMPAVPWVQLASSWEHLQAPWFLQTLAQCASARPSLLEAKWQHFLVTIVVNTPVFFCHLSKLTIALASQLGTECRSHHLKAAKPRAILAAVLSDLGLTAAALDLAGTLPDALPWTLLPQRHHAIVSRGRAKLRVLA